MLKHQKIVLQGVSYNQDLFKKELIKTILWLDENEEEEFRRWVKSNFYTQHQEAIDEVFYHWMGWAV